MFTITIVNREKVKIEGEFTKNDLKWLDETLYHLKPVLDDPKPQPAPEPEPVKLHEKHDEAAARRSFPIAELDGGPIF
jgi:hypothetical protein